MSSLSRRSAVAARMLSIEPGFPQRRGPGTEGWPWMLLHPFRSADEPVRGYTITNMPRKAELQYHVLEYNKAVNSVFSHALIAYSSSGYPVLVYTKAVNSVCVFHTL